MKKLYIVTISIHDGENEYRSYFFSETENQRKLLQYAKKYFLGGRDYRGVEIEGWTELPEEDQKQVKELAFRYFSIV